MSESNVISIVDSLSEAGASDSILYKLAAIGINSAYNSYRSDKEQIMTEFGNLPKLVIAEMWEDLEDRIKVSYVNENADTFREWLRSE